MATIAAEDGRASIRLHHQTLMRYLGDTPGA